VGVAVELPAGVVIFDDGTQRSNYPASNSSAVMIDVPYLGCHCNYRILGLELGGMATIAFRYREVTGPQWQVQVLPREAGTQADTSRGLFRRSQTGGNRHRRGAAWVKQVAPVG